MRPLLSLLALAFLVSGCSSEPELITVESEGLVFDRPVGWEEIEDLTGGGSVGTQGWVSEPGDGGTRVGLFVDVFCASDPATIVDALVEGSRQQIDSFEVVQRRRVDVAGADEAILVETGYGQESAERNASVALQRFDQVATTRGVGVRMGVVGPEDALDRDLAKRMLESLEMTPSDEVVEACEGAGADPTVPPVDQGR